MIETATTSMSDSTCGRAGGRLETRAQLSEGGRGKNPDGVRVLGWWVGLIFFISHVEAGKIVAPLGAPTRPRGGHRPRGEMDKINSCTDASSRNPHRLPRFWRAWSPKRRAEADARWAGPMGPGPGAPLYASGAGALALLVAGVGFRALGLLPGRVSIVAREAYNVHVTHLCTWRRVKDSSV